METLNSGFLFLMKDVNSKKVESFTINETKNELINLANRLMKGDIDYLIGYNNVNFDAQVVEFILKNYVKWVDLDNKIVYRKIAKFAQEVIHTTNYGLFPPFREDEFTIKQIDLFLIMHYNNENRRTSLKWLQYMMNWHNVEEMPYSHLLESLTEQEWLETIDYCENDVDSTGRFYDYVIGNVEHPIYKGKNKVQDRLDLIKSGILPARAINYSDSKIGDELNKINYCKLTGKSEKDLYTLKKNRKGTKKFTFGDAIPDYVKFKTKAFSDFYNSVKNKNVPLVQSDKSEFKFTFNKTTYSIARGGIHSSEKNRITIPKPNEILLDADVGSQYPNAIRKRKLFPKHLGIEWNTIGVQNIQKRLDHKKKASDSNLSDDERRMHQGLSETYKLALNSGYFGKTLEITNWQYAPEVGYYCTIGNQFEILMLIEMLEMADIHCISANTDGIVCLFDRSKLDTYYKVCKEWEVIVGNNEMGMLEYTEFSKIVQESVNHYIAIKPDGKVKVKGRFDPYSELHKNNSDKISRIERKAFIEYFSKGIKPSDFIKSTEHSIYDFCIGKKASRDYRWETINEKGRIKEYKKMIRFYISENGEKLIKKKNEQSEATGTEITQFFQGRLVTIFNEYVERKDYKIDYDYYINNINDVISKIDTKFNNSNQLNLF